MSQLRIQLSWKMNKREARVLKSPHLPELSTFFQITVSVDHLLIIKQKLSNENIIFFS